MTQHLVNLKIALRPVWHNEPPEISLGIEDNKNIITLTETTEFDLNFECDEGDYTLNIELLNKKDSDTVPEKNLDKAVVIERITMFGISDPKFVWAGVYTPEYPKKWAKEQKKAGVVLEQHLTNHNYLGWNGKWTLTFGVPVFTWVHKTQNLGWIYD